MKLSSRLGKLVPYPFMGVSCTIAEKRAAGLVTLIALFFIACSASTATAPGQPQSTSTPLPVLAVVTPTPFLSPTVSTPSAPAPTQGSTGTPAPTPARPASLPTPALPTSTPAPPLATPTPVTPKAQNPPKEVVLELVAGSMARYRVREQFARLSLPNDAVGETSELTGMVVFDASGAVQKGRSKITVNLRTLRSDEDDRDDFLRTDALESDRFPLAEFAVQQTPGLPWPLPSGGNVPFQLQGDLTVHDVTSPTTWEVRAQFSPNGVVGRAMTSFQFSKFNMKRPSAFFLLSVEDNIRLELDFIALIHSVG